MSFVFLNTLSLFLPSRAARDLSVFALTGEGLQPTTIVCSVLRRSGQRGGIRAAGSADIRLRFQDR